MRRKYDRRSVIRWTRGLAVLLFIQATFATILAFILLPPIRQYEWRALFPSPGPLLTREGSLLFTAMLIVSGIALWRLERWGLLVLATAVLLFSVPLALTNLRLADLTGYQSAEEAFFIFGPVCVPYFLLSIILVYFWRALKAIGR